MHSETFEKYNSALKGNAQNFVIEPPFSILENLFFDKKKNRISAGLFFINDRFGFELSGILY
jgi:hypothetical protein